MAVLSEQDIDAMWAGIDESDEDKSAVSPGVMSEQDVDASWEDFDNQADDSVTPTLTIADDEKYLTDVADTPTIGEPKVPETGVFTPVKEIFKALGAGIEEDVVGVLGKGTAFLAERAFAGEPEDLTGFKEKLQEQNPELKEFIKLSEDNSEALRGSLAKKGRAWADAWAKKASEGIEAPLQGTTFRHTPITKTAQVIGRAIPFYATAIAATIITKSPAIASGLFGVTQTAETYENARAKGLEPEAAATLALMDGVWTSGSEALPFNMLLGKHGFKALKKLQRSGIAGRAAAGAIVEPIQEVSQTVGSNMIAHYGFDKGIKLFEGWLEALVGGLFLGGAGGGAVKAEAPTAKPEVKDVKKTPEIKAKAEGEVKATLTIPPEEKAKAKPKVEKKVEPKVEEPKKTTKLTKAETEAIVEVEGLPKETQQETFERAKSKGLDKSAEALAEEVLATNKPISPEERAGLHLRTAQVEAELDRATAEAELVDDKTDPLEAQRLDQVENDLILKQLLLRGASGIAGSQAGRSLALQQVAIDKGTYEIAKLLPKARDTKGSDLTKTEKDKIKKLAEQIKNQEDKIKRLEKELAKTKEGKDKRKVNKKILDEAAKAVKFKREIDEMIFKLRKRTLVGAAKDIANLPRALLATADISAVFRQGLMLGIGRPVTFAKNIAKSLPIFFSQTSADKLDIMIRRSAKQEIREKSGLFMSDINQSLGSREEAFISRAANKIPVLSHVMKASERHMSGFLNLMRVSAFDSFVDANPTATKEQLEAFAKYVNAASGRGNLGNFENAAGNLATVIFSPRFAVSRPETVIRMVKGLKDPLLRKVMVKDMLAFVGTGMLTLTLASLGGAKVGLDPEKSDFGKIVIGDTRIDIWAGFAQPARLLLTPILQGLDTAGIRKATSRLDTTNAIKNFARYKASPPVSIALSLVSGKTAIGKEVTPLETLVGNVIPLALQEAVELANSDLDASAIIPLATAAFMGVGVSVHDKKRRRIQ